MDGLIAILDKAVDNDLVVILWFGFCIGSLQKIIPFLFLKFFVEDHYHQQDDPESSSLSLTSVVSFFIGVVWFNVVALGLPASMMTIPVYRCWKQMQRPPSWTFVLRLMLLLAMEVGTWACVKHMSQGVPPMMVMVQWMEDIPQIWWNGAVDATKWMSGLLVLIVVMIILQPSLVSTAIARMGLHRNDPTIESGGPVSDG